MDEKLLIRDQRIKVYVSSMLEGLAVERKAIRTAIRDDLKLQPIMFEPDADRYPPRNKYRPWLEQSHIYVGVFWESYGWIEPGNELSLAEDEYEIAKQKNLPRLVYLKKPIKDRDPRLETLIANMQAAKDIRCTSFDTPEELAEIVKDDIALVISERFGIAGEEFVQKTQVNHLSKVLEDLDQYGLVERPGMLSEIEKTLESDKKICLIGEPGCGKTFLLGQIGMKSKGVYISVRDRTPLEVYIYLTNHLRLLSGRPAEAFTSEDAARLDFEVSLQNSKQTLLIDDVDQNVPLARSLMALDYYQNEIIFAARSETTLGGYALRKVVVQPFTRQEIEIYVDQNGIEITNGEYPGLLHACNGNPLYLYYFTHFQADPLPSDLEGYQDAIWREFSVPQCELLGLIALSEFPLTLELLRDAHIRLEGGSSITEIALVLEELSPIVRVMHGHYEIFHPYFEESIVRKTDHLGLSRAYHIVLGEVNIANHNIVESTYHFLEAKDGRANQYLMEAARSAFLQGLSGIAEKFLERRIEIAQMENDLWYEGFSRYHLCFILRNSGLLEKAQSQLEKAGQAFEACGDDNWLKFVVVQQHLDRILQGEGLDALAVLEEQLDLFEGVDPIGEAGTLVNLSYAYIRMSRFEEGAAAAKKAYDIFANEQDCEGLIASLVNLTSCLAQLKKPDLASGYAKKIIVLAQEQGLPRLKSAGLNHLALILREGGDPQGARECLEEAVSICQRLGMVPTEIMNILNLGNTYRDEDDFTNAEKYYQEGLDKAREYDVKVEEGRALELMALVKRSTGDPQSAIEFASEAIEIQKKTGDSLRIAASLVERAQAYVAQSRNQEAAQDYEEAGNHYRTVSKFDNSVNCYETASCQWVESGDEEKALTVLERAIELAFECGDLDAAASSIKKLQKTKRIGGLDACYLTVVTQDHSKPCN